MDKKNGTSLLKYIALINYIGFSIAAPVIGGVMLGKYLDDLYNSRFIFLLIFTVLGVLTGFRNLYVFALKNGTRK